MRRLLLASLPLLASCAVPKPTVLSQTGSGDIPLVRLSDGYYAKVALGKGKTGLFLVDSGSGQSYVTPKGYAELMKAGAKRDENGFLTVDESSMDGYPVELPYFRPWGDNQDTMAEPSDGILGIDFLAHYKVGLDFGAKTMRLWPQGTDLRAAPADWLDRSAGVPPGASSPKRAYRIALAHYDESILTAPLRFDGATVDAVVDTGSSHTYVSAGNARALGWTYEKRESHTSFYNGPARLKLHNVDAVALGGIGITGRHPVMVPQNDNDVSLLGLDVLSPLTMLLDVEGEQLVVAWKYPVARSGKG